jgi:hypothetical protein
MLAIMLGDFIHNLRNALDHIVWAASLPKYRSHAAFPVAFEDLWELDADGQLTVKHAEARHNFETAVKGLDPRAIALVIAAQPYHVRDQAHRWTYGIISRLENADKHRRLIAVGAGVQNVMSEISLRGRTAPIKGPFLTGEFAYGGTIVGFRLPPSAPGLEPPVRPSEMQMKYSGTALIFVKITGVRGNQTPSEFPLYSTMLLCLRDVRFLLRLMEPFVH